VQYLSLLPRPAPEQTRPPSDTSPIPDNYGPVIGAVVRLINEINYIVTDVKPRVNPFQLPSAPTQTAIVGTLGAYTPNGDPFSVTVTTAPTTGTVTIARRVWDDLRSSLAA
jgi:hypothetical protein